MWFGESEYMGGMGDISVTNLHREVGVLSGGITFCESLGEIMD